MNLLTGAKKAVKECMNIQSNESVLIITDHLVDKKIPKSLFEASKEITNDVEIANMEPLEMDGQEPQKKISNLMKKADVLFLVTSKSLSHTKARRDACKKGVRIASMPQISEFSLSNGGLTADYNEVAKLCKKMYNSLENHSKFHIYSNNGTDLEFDVRSDWIKDDGIYHNKGEWGNLPAGEVFISPDENSSNGVLVIDNMGEFSSIRVDIKNGYAEKVENCDWLENVFKKLGKDARNVAEFGIGTNPKAKLIGNILEDEKVFGTVHVAFGNNAGFGGKITVPFHKDGIVTKPTLEADGKIIIKNGKWKI